MRAQNWGKKPAVRGSEGCSANQIESRLGAIRQIGVVEHPR